jgi:nicotinamidase-related amidase
MPPAPSVAPPAAPHKENQDWTCRSALIIVDMQNNFVDPDGFFGGLAKAGMVDLEFLRSPITNIKRMAVAFRAAGRPVVYLMSTNRPDFLDSCAPPMPGQVEKKFLVEGTLGAQIIDELKPEKGDIIVVKKGFGGFAHTELDFILRHLGVTTCVFTGVATEVCVSSTIREGTYYGYQMIIVSDGCAGMSRETHKVELNILSGAIAVKVKTTDEVIGK